MTSRFPLVDIDALSGPVGETLRARPGRLNIVSIMAYAPGCVLQQLQLGRAINTEQELDPLFRELLVLLAAHLDGSEYIWRQHVPIATRHGATPGKIDALAKGDISSEVFSDDERCLLRFGREVVRGGAVDEPTVEAALRHHSHQTLVEAILAIGYYMTMNRITSATLTPFEDAGPGRSTAMPRQPWPAEPKLS